MEKTAIVVYHEYDNVIGIAETYKAVVDCIKNYFGGQLKVWDNELCDLRVVTEKEEKEIYTMGIDRFNQEYECIFYLKVYKLWQS